MQLTIVASPSPDIVLRHYDPALFPKFRVVFEDPEPGSPLGFLVCPPEEAQTAVVLENLSARDITALRHGWMIKREDGSENRRTISADSYAVDVYHPVLRAADRTLITWSRTVGESLLDHLRGGGGLMGAGASHRPLGGIVASLQFEIDFVLFADGEIAGPDRERFGDELRCRKPAAEFVAKQIRLAQSESRDVKPVLSAIRDMPRLSRLRGAHGDPLVHWIQYYAREYLGSMGRKIGSVDMPEAELR